MDGKETAKRKQVLEGNAFYEIDLECMRKKERREEMEKREREAGKRSTETETVSLKENSGEKKPRGG